MTELTNSSDVQKANHERSNGPYVRAIFNPEAPQFQEMVKGSNLTILDIGCGEKPRLSWQLESGDLWVGCDPAATNGVVIKGEHPIKQGALLVVYPLMAEEIPTFKPDVISIIAPSQEEIIKGYVFNDTLKKFLDPKKEQVLVVVLDTRTEEAAKFQEEAKQIIKDWRSENGFKPDAENQILDKFRLNSADAGVKNIRLCYIRNPSR
jgi:hypothetical protein